MTFCVILSPWKTSILSHKYLIKPVIHTEDTAADDSDDEFTNEVNPYENTAQQQDLFTDEESNGECDEREKDHKDELTPLILPKFDTASQETPEDLDTTSSLDTQSLGN